MPESNYIELSFVYNSNIQHVILAGGAAGVFFSCCPYLYTCLHIVELTGVETWILIHMEGLPLQMNL